MDYTVGLKINAALKRRSDDLLAEAVARFEATGQPQRLFAAFWYQAGSWPFLSHYQAVSAAVNEACARLALDTS